MQLIGRVVILAMCLFCAYTLPTSANSYLDEANIADGVYQLIRAQMRSALIDTHAMTSGEAACANQYNNATQTVNNQLVNQTNACFEKANQTRVANNRNVNTTVMLVHTNLMDVVSKINNCSAINDTNLFLNCTTASFDFNLLHLDAANTQAYRAKTEMVTNSNQVDTARQACIDTATGTAKINLTLATNQYSVCLARLKMQRSINLNMLLN